MPRPCKRRRVGCSPKGTCYKPAGIPTRDLIQIDISLDELEAMRLVDGEGKYQEEAAKEMEISRATLGRVLASGRKKVADALINGHAIILQGGNVINSSEDEE